MWFNPWPTPRERLPFKPGRDTGRSVTTRKGWHGAVPPLRSRHEAVAPTARLWLLKERCPHRPGAEEGHSRRGGRPAYASRSPVMAGRQQAGPGRVLAGDISVALPGIANARSPSCVALMTGR